MKANYEDILNGTIVESDLTASNGYIRYENGLQIAWKSATVVAGGTAWGNIYYSDHTLGNWAKAFTNVFNVLTSVDATQYWTTCNGYTTSSTGTVRAFRPNNGTLSVKLTAIGIGTWK